MIEATAALHAKIQKQLAPMEDDLVDTTVPSLNIHSIWAIAKIRNPDLSFEEADIASEAI